MPKLSKRIVEGIAPGSGDVFVWDSEQRGFGVRVKPSGARSYILQYRNAHGRSKRLTLGAHGRLTAEMARREAKRLLADVDRGADPAAERDAARKAPTLAAFAERYLADHVAANMKNAAEERRMLARVLLPALGARKLADITRADVAKLHRDLRATPIQATRVVSLLSRMMNLAEKWGDRPDGSNPCRRVDISREQARAVSERRRARQARRGAGGSGTHGDRAAQRHHSHPSAGADRLPSLRNPNAEVGAR
jgi:hypothetical protein